LVNWPNKALPALQNRGERVNKNLLGSGKKSSTGEQYSDHREKNTKREKKEDLTQSKAVCVVSTKTNSKPHGKML